MIAIKIGTVSRRHTDVLAGDEVEFTGVYLYEADGLTPAMVWDATIGPQGNVRAKVAADYVADAAANLLQLYAQAKALMTADAPGDKRWKALVLVLLDELNLHAAKHNAILTAIDGAATFAAMKTAIASIADYPTRTVAQLKTSMGTKIDAGQTNG